MKWMIAARRALWPVLLSSFSASASWTLTVPMEAVRISRNSVVVLSDQRIVFASRSAEGEGCGGTIYSPYLENWTTTGCTFGHRFAPAVSLADTVLSVSDSGSTVTMDSESLLWRISDSTRYPHAMGALVALDGTRAIIVGDYPDGDGSQCELYDLTTGSWSSCGQMSRARVWPAATRLNDGRVLVAGGAPPNNSAEIYDPKAGAWSQTQPMRGAHVGPDVTLLQDGRVLLVGGWPQNTAEIYDPSSNGWSTTNRPGHLQAEGAVLLTMTDGRVLHAGGGLRDGQDVSDTAEIFDPATETWTDAGRMNVGRVFPMAANRPDGSVLVAGGVSGQRCVGKYCTEVYTLSAEIFTP